MNCRKWIQRVALAIVTTAITIGCGATSGSGDLATTDLHQAVENGDMEQVKALLMSGVDVNATDGNGQTPLHIAAREGDTEMVQVLVEYGADLYARDEQNRTPRSVAAGLGMTETEEALLELEG